MAPKPRSTQTIGLALGAAAVLTLAVITIAVARSETDETSAPGSPASTSAPSPTPPAAPVPRPPPDLTGIGAVTTHRGTVVRSEPSPDAPTLSVLREGVLLQVTGRRDSFLSVMTPCEASGWVSANQVDLHKKDTEPATSMEGATIVLDPGHGGQLPGARGPGGYTEKEANLDIAKRLAPKLEGARVFLTRTGDYTAGLPFRAGLANNLGADLLVSIHNNAAPDGPSEKPGTETYYQQLSASSKRLAGILYEEVFRVLEPVELAWMSDEDAGAKYRTNVSGEDFYGILRRSTVPAVIVEAMFISNAPEENLLRTHEAREGIAGALAKGIRRYLETKDSGSGFVEPLNRNEGSSGQLPSVCVEPT